MSDDVQQLFNSALQLNGQDRAELAGMLLGSIEEEEQDADAQAAWSDEIARRLEELSSGSVTPVPWAEVRRRLSKAAG
jgi:putative addiction module component (TIGR02574 family)